MKTKNKLLLAFVAVCVFVGIVNVHAITTGNTNGQSDTGSKIVTDTATLNVTGIQTGDQFAAYKILDTFYNASTNVITYEFTADFKNFLKSDEGSDFSDLTVDDYYGYSSGDISTGSTISASDLDRLASAYAGYLKKNSVSGIPMNVSGTTASATLQAGSYLVLPTTTLKVYAVMVGNLDFAVSGNDWQINNETIVAKVSDAGIEKSVGEEGYDSGSYSIGDEIPFVIVGTVPTYPTNATNKVYTITDTVSEGLDFSGISSVVIRDGSVSLKTSSNGEVKDSDDNVVANIAIQGKTMTITFHVDYVKSNKVTVHYTARLNENAGLGANGGNTNSASLTYSNDPYGTGTSTTNPDDGGKVQIYLYGLEIYKYDDNDGSPISLENAEFTIYKDRDLRQVVEIITTNRDGIAKLSGLGAGTYYVQETKAPTGYRLDKTVKEIKIGPGEGSLDAAEEDGYYRLEVANAKVGLLPVTGGIGTIFITLLGLAIVAGSVYFFFLYHRKKKNQGGQA